MDASEVLFVVFIIALALGGVSWVLKLFVDFMSGLRRGRYGSRAAARIVDVTVFDTMSDNTHYTRYRVLLQFTPEHGEQVVVDAVLEPSRAQKDMLLPDHVVMIEYDSRDPQNFRIDFAAGLQPADAAGSQAAAQRPAARAEPSLYGPRR